MVTAGRGLESARNAHKNKNLLVFLQSMRGMIYERLIHVIYKTLGDDESVGSNVSLEQFFDRFLNFLEFFV